MAEQAAETKSPDTKHEWGVITDMMDAYHRRAGHTFLRADTLKCDRHGKYDCRLYQGEDGEIFGGKCPDCHAEDERKRSEQEASQMAIEHQQRMLERRIGNAAIPLRFLERTLENYEITEGEKQKAIHDFCTGYAADFDKASNTGASIIFSGGVGTGKTHLSIGIASKILRDGYTARYATVSSCVRRVRASWRSDTETEDDAIRLFSVPDLLILDEVGLQSGSDNEHQILFEILNARYEDCQPTILITNLPLRDDVRDGVVVAKGLQSYIGDRLLDRMREGGGKAFTLDWKSGRAGR